MVIGESHGAHASLQGALWCAPWAHCCISSWPGSSPGPLLALLSGEEINSVFLTKDPLTVLSKHHSKMPLLPGLSSWSPDQYTSLFSISAELGCGVYLHLTTFFLSVLYTFPSPEKLPLCCMHWRLVSFSSPRANTLDTNRSQGLETLKSVETIRVQSIYNTGSTEMHHRPCFY